MRIRILWPGRTKTAAVRALEDFYLKRLAGLLPCEIVVTEASRGLDEKETEKILEIEARGLEKRLKDDYIVCLSDKGREMNSEDFGRFIEKRAISGTKSLAFVVGGFLGLAPRILDRADLRMSLSKMTLSHELCRAVLLEQIYRGASLMKGRSYAK
ncbi:MAG: 23S rRNA (pseudouridine(1915)-N(3))-methyltransferase RlmH [Acidobacteriota bacterium]|jgi:23S rRNA (pseudouridine1915-N3)-methyltransferase|nr:23S rRNA (pseudouridine(1915)-N(3))-methyltransferase RlmH [Acidobacteriota bacterium]MDD8032443.1 23S rRNA (pseudouridine(1915)-N(3))-methyltransferase RlmH [Acidobacteriota bacterium]MDD8038281.1 23S rRNA (pseudouridine(1915)-N(3))-methyltransferase RlmH [Acidobacteriota bacterium]HQF97012.1 23S rRNA (pseudouridine(1915)-N(3))-methyltransferase RlmH [Candidatus Aminicenantes bacterium]HQJ42394.1 23S rRNA (pseudouridine(1915)-N(3))-methyltransferase RlmH [Candidatus Aminicenantes bacterium]